MHDDSTIERAITRAFNGGRYTRRIFLRRAGKGVVVAASALSLPSILAACGIGPGAVSYTHLTLPTTPYV